MSEWCLLNIYSKPRHLCLLVKHHNNVFFSGNRVRGETDLYGKRACVCGDHSTFPCCSNRSYFKLLIFGKKRKDPDRHCGGHWRTACTCIAMTRLGQRWSRDKGQVRGWWTLKMCLFLLLLHFCGNCSWESEPWAICHVFTEQLCQEAQTSGGRLLDAL